MVLIVLQRVKREFITNVDFRIPPSMPVEWGPGICLSGMLLSCL